jgi:Arm DNA-binding domain
MSWCLRYRAGSRARKLVFARYPGLPLPEARKVATGLYGQVASGRDPGAERKVSRRREKEVKAPVRDIIDKVARQYLKQAAKRTRARTAAEASRIFRVYVLPHGRESGSPKSTRPTSGRWWPTWHRGRPSWRTVCLRRSRRCSIGRLPKTF